MSSVHLLALRLSRALSDELPKTQAICMNNSWNTALADEVRLFLFFSYLWTA